MNNIGNKNILFPKSKYKDKDKISEIKNETSLKEDLSFLGNSNKLNWNLISDEDKERGIIFWRKFLKYIMYNKIDEDKDNSIKNRNMKRTNFTSTDTEFNNHLKNKDKKYRYMSAILKTHQFLKEHNRRKRMFSLDLYNSFNSNSQTIIRKNFNSERKKKINQKINDEFKDKLPMYDNKIEKKNYFNQKGNKTFKYKFNIKNSFNKNNSNKTKNSKNKIKSSIFKTPNNKFSKNNYNINQNYSDKKYKKSNLRIHNIQDNSLEDKKQVNFMVEETPSKKDQLVSSTVPTKKTSNNDFKKYLRKSSKKLKRINVMEIESLEEVKQYLLNYYKLSDGVYSSINLNNNEPISSSEESKDEKNEDSQKKVKEPTKIIDLFGIKVRVKNSNKVLEEYLLKRHIEQKELIRQIKFKSKLLLLIRNLEEEKKERMKLKEKERNKFKREQEGNNIEINDEYFNDRRKSRKRKKKDKTNNDSDSDEDGFDFFRSKKKFFVNRRFKSRKDVEIRKLELLYNIKNDLNYKIMKGYINISDYDIYDKLKERLAKLINIYSMQDYIDRIEECFSDFREEVLLVEQRRRNEQRINAFVKDLNHQIDMKSIKKNIQEKTLCNVINYDTVNHINILNNI